MLKGYTDGYGVDELNIDMQIKNCAAYKRVVNIKSIL